MSRLVCLLSLIVLTLVACGQERPVPTAGEQAIVLTRRAISTEIASPLDMAASATPIYRGQGVQATSTPTDIFVTPSPTSTTFVETTITTTPEETPLSLAEILQGDHFWLGRPFSGSGGVRDYIEYAYPYGTTALGYQPHHGVDTPNAFGTPVRAAASGTVFYAGDDFNEPIYGPHPNFYGNVIVLEHNFEVPGKEGVMFSMYTLYGHLSEFFVRTGDTVTQFQEIGAVGQAGVAIGPHLHMEVRLGDPYDYGSTYNPNLWIQPWPRHGVLAGRVKLTSGEYLTDVEVELISEETDRVRTTLTYHYDEVNIDPWFVENFVVPDLPEGLYTVKVKYLGRIAHQTTVNVLPERVTMVNALID